MPAILIDESSQTRIDDQAFELVERKGRGHPDTICDAIAERISTALSRTYLERFGRVLHHNIDKNLLVAGRSAPRLGGGAVLEPMRLILGDRATTSYGGQQVDVDAIACAEAAAWFREGLRFVDPDAHLLVQSELRPGSAELTDIFEREVMGANDTSAAVGYAPLSETEHLVLAAERHLNAPAFKARFPEAGEDVKVMGLRRGRHLSLTVAVAFVDRFVPDAIAYFARKAEMTAALEAYLETELRNIVSLDVAINTLDDPGRGASGMYLTVLGTSAEGADGGQAGRGNRVNGLIAIGRPMSAEAAAGKNPVSHVGKIYSFLSDALAADLVAQVPGVEEATVWLCSQIGRPIGEPQIAAARLALAPGAALADARPAAAALIEAALADIGGFCGRLARGELGPW